MPPVQQRSIERGNAISAELNSIVHADSDRAIALYEKVGFVHEGRIRNAFRADGIYRDALAMAIVRE